jgi:hypothetical protein
MTDFFCPVANCKAVYADWEALHEHLSKEHGQDIAREQYDEWLRHGADIKADINDDIEASPDQHPLSGSDADIVPDNMSRDEADIRAHDEGDGYTCSECGKSFSSFNSLKMHSIRSHRVKLGISGGEEERRGPPPKPREEERVHPPDDLEELRDQLVTFRLSPQNAESVVEYMKGFATDDLPRLNRALQSIGMPVDRKRMFLERWISTRGVAVDPRLADELGLWLQDDRYDYRGPTSGSRGYYRREDDVWQEKRMREDEVKRARDDGFAFGQILSRLERIEEGSRIPYQNPKDDELERERKEKEALRRQLDEEREKRHQSELRALEERMTLKIESLKKEEGTILERQGVRAVERVGDVAERLVGLGEKVVTATAVKHGILGEEAPTPRERGGAGNIEDLLPPEYLERTRAEVEEK